MALFTGFRPSCRYAGVRLIDAGCALLVVSEELDELFDISDRLLVMAKGSERPLYRGHCIELGPWPAES